MMSGSGLEGGQKTAGQIPRYVSLLGVCLLVGCLGVGGGCTAMSANYWGRSGGGFIRLFGDAGPAKPSGPTTVSEWMGQPRPQP
ncbi:MAG TPA: hypothetical protein PK777_11075 [Thermoguttaceae bacterium]|jgi:hypothetical protein|nr:hypothetical protein [Thermoguttaceae bacterium]